MWYEPFTFYDNPSVKEVISLTYKPEVQKNPKVLGCQETEFL